MTPRIFTVLGDGLVIEASLNGSPRTVDVRLYQGTDTSGALIDAAGIPILDIPKRDEWIARIEKEAGGKAGSELRQMVVKLAGEIIAAKAKDGAETDDAPAGQAETWADPVNGEVLLGEIEAAIRRFVVMHRQEHYTAVALWVVFAHAHDAFRFSPILIATSPEKGSGKTRLLEIVSELTPRPWLTSSPSDAVVFRKIDKARPTFLLDEGDNVDWRERQQLLSIFNAGYQRRTATVPRCIGEGASLDTADFSTWCPKGLSCLKVPLPDTTVSRSIVIPFKKKTRSEVIESLRERTAIAVFTPLRRQAARWATDNLEALRDAEPETIKTLTDRTADVWEPLLAVADLAGGEWPERARDAALYFGGGADAAESAGAMLLADLRDLFAARATDRLSSRDILDDLKGREDRPWSEWVGGRELSPRGVAKLLKPFGITPGTARSGDKTFKGYLRDDFKDAWSRYLPDLSVTSVTSVSGNDLGGDLSVTSQDRVTDTRSAKAMRGNDVTDVTDRKPGEGQEVLL
jgi:putative DNA primase/helicase